MKFLRTATLTGVALFCTASVFAAAPPRTLHMVMSQSMAAKGGKAMNQNLQIWIKGSKARVATGAMVMISNGKQQYMYMTKNPKKEYMSIPVQNSSATPQQQMTKAMNDAVRKGKKVGTARMNGHMTTIYSITSPDKKSTEKIWIANDLGAPIPMRDEKRSPQFTQIVEVQSVEVNKAIADSLFSVPAGYKKSQAPMMPPGARPPVRPPVRPR